MYSAIVHGIKGSKKITHTNPRISVVVTVKIDYIIEHKYFFFLK